MKPPIIAVQVKTRPPPVFFWTPDNEAAHVHLRPQEHALEKVSDREEVLGLLPQNAKKPITADVNYVCESQRVRGTAVKIARERRGRSYKKRHINEPRTKFGRNRP